MCNNSNLGFVLFFIIVTRTNSQGRVWITFNVMMKDVHKYGFDNVQRENTSLNTHSMNH